jgi:hypothetical protein
LFTAAGRALPDFFPAASCSTAGKPVDSGMLGRLPRCAGTQSGRQWGRDWQSQAGTASVQIIRPPAWGAWAPWAGRYHLRPPCLSAGTQMQQA